MRLDAKKLESMIEKFIAETQGPCIATGACIGVIDGKQVQLRVVTDGSDFMRTDAKWYCIKARAKGARA